MRRNMSRWCLLFCGFQKHVSVVNFSTNNMLSPKPTNFALLTRNSKLQTIYKSNHLCSNPIVSFSHFINKNIQKYIAIAPMKVESPKRYCLLLAARDSEYVKKVYGGYFQVFVAAFGGEGEQWDLFRVVDDHFPSVNELDKYDGFVVSGSPYDAYGNDLWILKLCFLLQTLDSMPKKILGICFGHQVLCRALGGKVGKACTGWDIGVRNVMVVKDQYGCSFLGHDDDIPNSLSIIECHQDEVWEVPAGAEVMAFSDKTGVEMFRLGNHIMGIQGHPEYTIDILSNLIDRLLQNHLIESGFAEDAKLRLEKGEPDRKCWKRICRNFLKQT